MGVRAISFRLFTEDLSDKVALEWSSEENVRGRSKLIWKKLSMQAVHGWEFEEWQRG